MNNKLWCDLKTDQEKAEFFRSGEAHGCGIIAKAIEKEVAETFQFLAVHKGIGKSTIKLGEYTLKPLDDESYFFEAPTGEGTGIDKRYADEIVESYFTGKIDEYFKSVM